MIPILVFKNRLEKFANTVEQSHGRLVGLEDWEYLIHHLHRDDKTGVETLHHCPLTDHLGNLWIIEHVKDDKGKFCHRVSGLIEDQEVFWSDEEAEEAGEKIPCANRQLK